MFDSKSDYALNKLDPDAIVCPSATGVHIRLTREDFASEYEFQHWKAWSDEDYHDTESNGREFWDSSVALSAALDSGDISAEDTFFAPMLAEDAAKRKADLIEQIKDRLTEKQYRRLRMYYLEGKTEAAIAAIEGVGQRRISTSLIAGRKALQKFLENF